MEFSELNRRVQEATPALPFKGIHRFFDISGILRDPNLFAATIAQLGLLVNKLAPEFVCALDARGFLLAAPVCLALKLPLIMIRKKGKLPGECVSTEYDKEYEMGDVLEIQSGSIIPGSRIVLIDDVLATGGTLRAAHSLVSQFNPSNVVGVCLIDIGLPDVAKNLDDEGIKVVSLFDASSW